MRSRYTAFANRTLDHVERTHAPEIRADFNRAEAERLAQECEWEGLEIRQTKQEGDDAEVEFVMRFRHEGQSVARAAASRFRRENERWFYVSNRLLPLTPLPRLEKIGRNAPCPCHSGKKAKKCCGLAAKSP